MPPMPDTPPPPFTDDWLRQRLDALDRRLDMRLARSAPGRTRRSCC